MKTCVIQDEPDDDHPAAPFAELPQSPEDQPDQATEVLS